MTATCPYCKSPMEGEAAVPRMSARMMRIYNTLLAAGPEGVPTAELIARMYADDEWPTPGGYAVLRGRIHLMNRKLIPHGQHIINWQRGRYRLVSVKDGDRGKKIYP